MNQSNEQIFTTPIEKEGSFIFVPIPFSPRDVWGARPRYSVTGTINDIPVRGTLGALGQDYFLRLSTKWLHNSGIELGTTVTIRLSLEE